MDLVGAEWRISSFECMPLRLRAAEIEERPMHHQKREESDVEFNHNLNN